jgi:ArsR family transcriptional regulator, arsenate/arsenite/antimonite-responsive transcriptional repressor
MAACFVCSTPGTTRSGTDGKAKNEPDVARYADMFSAMGTEPHLRIMRLLLSAQPQGMIAGDIGAELDIPASTLSHHLDKLKDEDLVSVHRESIYRWYSANTETLQELLGFIYAECCTRSGLLFADLMSRWLRGGNPTALARLNPGEYDIEDARAFLVGEGIDVNTMAPQVEDKFMSAFIRATKPARC